MQVIALQITSEQLLSFWTHVASQRCVTTPTTLRSTRRAQLAITYHSTSDTCRTAAVVPDRIASRFAECAVDRPTHGSNRSALFDQRHTAARTEDSVDDSVHVASVDKPLGLYRAQPEAAMTYVAVQHSSLDMHANAV